MSLYLLGRGFKKMKSFISYSDPGHGWAAVKRSLLISLGILNKITPFSFQKGKTVYLEEDCDVETFVKAYKQAYNVEPRFIHRYTNNVSPIRRYKRFNVST
jgi:hypothetical protein